MHWINRPLVEETLVQVLTSPHSAFYKQKYAAAGLDPARLTADDFLKLPLLSRADLAEVEMKGRTFTAPEEVRTVAFTSGTSTNKPLAVPIARVEHYTFEPSFGCDVSRTLLLMPPMMRGSGVIFCMRVAEEALRRVALIPGDLQNMANSAFIGSAALCDSLWALPTLAVELGPYAAAAGLANNIRLLMLAGEATTKAALSSLRALYPNALIGSFYGSNELSQIVLFTCPAIMRTGKNRFHAVVGDIAALELIDGELVITYGLNHASPLIRYRTGDYFDEVPEGCPCGLLGPVIAWSHRGGVDRLRVNGMEFNIEQADNAFAVFPHVAGKEYQVHFYPVQGSTAVALKIEIAEPSVAVDAVRAKELAQFVEREVPVVWKLSTTATVQTAIERGAIASFSVSVVPALSEKGVKIKRFINHVV